MKIGVTIVGIGRAIGSVRVTRLQERIAREAQLRAHLGDDARDRLREDRLSRATSAHEDSVAPLSVR